MNKITKANVRCYFASFLLLLTANVSSLAMDSTNMAAGKQVTATAHSYVLATGAGSFIQGENQQIGTTNKPCQAGAYPKVVASLGDTGQSQNNTSCALNSFHVVNPFVTYNQTGGYDVYVGSINISSSDVCNDRDGASLNWTVFCMKDA